MKIARPVVRSFHPEFARDCAAWVRAGGHAVLWETPERARLVVGHFDKKDLQALDRWAILDLGKPTYHVVKRGPFRGLVTTPVPDDALDVVRERVLRDSRYARPRRTMNLECQECAACCKSNDVTLLKKDRQRLRRGKIQVKTRREDGKLMLKVLSNGNCQKLQRDNSCGIYKYRPDACREFPVGSECCLFAREEELGITDGLPPPT